VPHILCARREFEISGWIAAGQPNTSQGKTQQKKGELHRLDIFPHIRIVAEDTPQTNYISQEDVRGVIQVSEEGCNRRHCLMAADHLREKTVDSLPFNDMFFVSF
jgi:hypothetical protein